MRLVLSILLFFVWQAEAHAAGLSSPNVSGNALFRYRNSNFAQTETGTVRNGLDIQEAELAFYADVDPYSRLNILLTVHPEYTSDLYNGNPALPHKISKNWVVEPEEAYAETNHIPQTTLKIGKFKAAMGKHNQLHEHAYPFVEAPLVNQQLLGDEGLADVGLSAAVLLPMPWYSEITGQYLRGEGENAEFNSASPNDSVGLAHFKNLWDLNDSLTFESGFSYAQGQNYMYTGTRLLGADVTFKWRPTDEGKYHSGIFGAEYLNRSVEQPGQGYEIGSGWYAFGGYQFAERWQGLLRYDKLDVNGSADVSVNPNTLNNIGAHRYSASLVYTATEFSAYRLEYNQQEGLPNPSGNGERVERKIYLQANFTIGAHPAHSY